MEEQATTPAQKFYDGAEGRLLRIMPMIAVLATAALLGAGGWPAGAGMALGCLVAYANFYWLKRIVAGMADRATLAASPPSSAGIVFKFLIRYALLGIAAYVILSVSPASLYGFLGGMFLPVAGMIVEAGYEAYVAQTRGY